MNNITPEMLLRCHIEDRQETKRKRTRRNFIIFLSITLLIALIVDFCLIYNQKKREEYESMAFVPYNHIQIPYSSIKCDLTKGEIRQKLDRLYRIDYSYEEIDEIEQLEWGYVNGNHIMIYKNVRESDYIFVLAHEMTHIKYGVSNEIFVEYKTITMLYESGNKLFKQVALNRARFIVGGGVTREYDCGYYLLQYFKGEIYV